MRISIKSYCFYFHRIISNRINCLLRTILFLTNHIGDCNTLSDVPNPTLHIMQDEAETQVAISRVYSIDANTSGCVVC